MKSGAEREIKARYQIWDARILIGDCYTRQKYLFWISCFQIQEVSGNRIPSFYFVKGNY